MQVKTGRSPLHSAGRNLMLPPIRSRIDRLAVTLSAGDTTRIKTLASPSPSSQLTVQNPFGIPSTEQPARKHTSGDRTCRHWERCHLWNDKFKVAETLGTILSRHFPHFTFGRGTSPRLTLHGTPAPVVQRATVLQQRPGAP